MLWAASFVAGFFTFGFCWPRKLRRFFCAPSTKEKSDSSSKTGDGSSGNSKLSEMFFSEQPKPTTDTTLPKDARYEALEQRIVEMKGSIETLQKTVEALVQLQSKGAEQGEKDKRL